MVLSVLGRQKAPRNVPPRFCQGSTKVPQVLWCLSFSGADYLGLLRRFRQGCTKVAPRFFKFCGVPFSLGQLPNRFCGRFTHHFKLVSQLLNSFWHFSPTALALGSPAIGKVLGQQMAFASQKAPAVFRQMAVASRVLPTILSICVPNGCCIIKVFWRVRQVCALHVCPRLLLG